MNAVARPHGARPPGPSGSEPTAPPGASAPGSPLRARPTPRPLRLRVAPWGDESLLSILARAAARNFHDRTAPLVCSIAPGCTDATVLRSDPAVAGPLAALLGLAAEEIAARQYPRLPGPTAVFRGTRLPHAMVMGATRRIAPEALRRAPYHRAVWDLTALDVCPETGDRLLDGCPECGKRLRWIGSAVHACHACRFDLRRAPPRIAGDEVLDGARFVADLLEPARGAQAAARSVLAPEFADAAEGDLVAAMVWLGSVARSAEGTVPPADLARRWMLWRPDERHLHLSAALPLLKDWRPGIGRLLERLRAAQTRDGHSGGTALRDHFGPVFAKVWLCCLREAEPALRDTLKTATRRYFEGHPQIAVSAKLAGQIGLPRGDRVMTAADAGREFGLVDKALQRLVAAFPEAVAQRGAGHKRPMLLSRPVLAGLAGAIADLSLPVSLEKEYGIGPRARRALVAVGALTPVQGRLLRLVPGNAARQSGGVFSRREVEALVARLSEALPVIPQRRRGLVGLSAVIARCRARGMRDRAPVFAAVLSGEIPPCGLTDAQGPGLRRLLFDAAAVGAFCDARLGPTFKGALPTATAARMLGWHQSQMRRMVEHGFVACCSVDRAYGGAILVSEAEARRAGAEYVSPKEIARAHGVTWMLVGRRLRAAGIRPVLHGTDEGEMRWGAVYRRADVAGLDLAGMFAAPRPSSVAPKPRKRRREAGAPRARPAPRGGEPPRGGLTDREWAALCAHLPPERGPCGRPAGDNRLAVDGMVHVVTSGRVWDRLPPEFGPHSTLYKRFRRWSADGVWDRARLGVLGAGGPAGLVELLEALAAAASLPPRARRPTPACAVTLVRRPTEADGGAAPGRAGARKGKARPGDSSERPAEAAARDGAHNRGPPPAVPAGDRRNASSVSMEDTA